ncbi:MAG: hypothetical protein WAS07_01145 [Micropruina sp.]|nr:hypothetical protein [Micropruina sp.]
MNHEFRAHQQAARERQTSLARRRRYRMRLSYLMAGVAGLTFLLTIVMLIGR